MAKGSSPKFTIIGWEAIFTPHSPGECKSKKTYSACDLMRLECDIYKHKMNSPVNLPASHQGLLLASQLGPSSTSPGVQRDKPTFWQFWVVQNSGQSIVFLMFFVSRLWNFGGFAWGMVGVLKIHPSWCVLFVMSYEDYQICQCVQSELNLSASYLFFLNLDYLFLKRFSKHVLCILDCKSAQIPS